MFLKLRDRMRQNWSAQARALSGSPTGGRRDRRTLDAHGRNRSEPEDEQRVEHEVQAVRDP